MDSPGRMASLQQPEGTEGDNVREHRKLTGELYGAQRLSVDVDLSGSSILVSASVTMENIQGQADNLNGDNNASPSPLDGRSGRHATRQRALCFLFSMAISRER